MLCSVRFHQLYARSPTHQNFDLKSESIRCVNTKTTNKSDAHDCPQQRWPRAPLPSTLQQQQARLEVESTTNVLVDNSQPLTTFALARKYIDTEVRHEKERHSYCCYQRQQRYNQCDAQEDRHSTQNHSQKHLCTLHSCSLDTHGHRLALCKSFRRRHLWSDIYGQ